jgi:transcriptional regulator with XRE-family HTH domain
MTSKDRQNDENNSASKKKTQAKKKPLEDQVNQIEALDFSGGTVTSVPEDQLGQRIIERRKTKQFSQEALAVMTRLVDPHEKGISRPTIVSYEKGTTLPGARELRLLADALQVTPSWLVLGVYDDITTEGIEQGYIRLFKELARLSIRTEIQDNFAKRPSWPSDDIRWQMEENAKAEGADITKKRNQTEG